ncbi:RagB/SusD family nutrient uptake outer membrane protein [Aquimarina sp. TRL1]|uniref:RagB/SusD family nutrient uptake outer membrane protein n=1 Tax=Aquimarina sp. (strain TRL1) TaxID=2736252 RepID=UPI001589FADF|nr:RagB/SusD family nutrient uptake outer membrane protein [Aquimarina sp. TRL1]QKX05460.1 RagB/SusD family nutrient uptake outer membrane protein [Aquimarina sp. TRL1]
MKKLIVLLPVIACILYSCDLERNPYDQISEDELFSDPESVKTATIGNYALLKGDVGYDGWVDDLHRISEYAGDNVSLSGGTTDHLFFLYNYQSITTNLRVERFWRNSYKIVVGCNIIIEKIKEGASEETDQLLGENYYLRALTYFQMGNVFGRPYNQGASNLSIPLKLTSDTEDRPDRHTIEEVYKQVIKDLEKAASLMTENKGASFASKEAAYALLSRVYLYKEDHEKTEEYANKVIESGEYSLLSKDQFSKMNTLTPEQNAEAIFAVTLSSASDLLGGGDDWYTIGSFYANVQGKGWGEMYASRTYLDLINKNPDDARKSFIDPQFEEDENGEKIPAVYWVNDAYAYEFRRTSESGGVISFEEEGTTYTVMSEEIDGKTNYYFNGPNGKQDVTKGYDMKKRNGHPKFYILKASLQENDIHMWSPMVSRLSEMYLNLAESQAKRGMDQLALDNINIIRERAGIPIYSLTDIPTGKTVLDIVLEERRLELAYEGHRRYDVYRNGRTMDRKYPGTHLNGTNAFLEIPAIHPRVVEFIPEQQIILQPSLIQND